MHTVRTGSVAVRGPALAIAAGVALVAIMVGATLGWSALSKRTPAQRRAANEAPEQSKAIHARASYAPKRPTYLASDLVREENRPEVVEAVSNAESDRDETPPTEEEREFHANSSFQADPADHKWARDSAYLIQGDLAKVSAAGIELGAVECRSTMCRFDYRFEDRDLGREFLRDFLRASIWEGPGMAVRPEQQGRTQMARVYLIRKGHPIPDGEPSTTQHESENER